MGLGLSHPISSKVLHRKGNDHFRVGAATMHGWRETMEDAHTIELSLPHHTNTAFFGIFDGHSGSVCSQYISDHLPVNLDKLSPTDIQDITKLRHTVMDTDQNFLDAPDFRNKDDGSAGIFTLATFNAETNTYKLVNGNIGDSRTVLARKNGEAYVAVTCTEDHKPTNDKERRRIEAAGGHVSLSRVDGQLALSRAFGDRMLKRPIDFPAEDRKVTSDPEFTIEEAGGEDFLFLACDGIYEGDIFSRESVISWITEKLKETDDIAQVCATVLDECLRRGSRDNMSCMIIQFRKGTEYDSPNTEYQPGPYFEEEGDTKFKDAYKKDAEAAGFSLDAALELRRKNSSAGTTQV